MRSLMILLLTISMAFANAQSLDTTHVEQSMKFPEQMPVYPGGEQALFKYLTQIPYPSISNDEDIPGSITVKFIVEKNGEVKEITIAKSSGHPLIDSAATKHLENMPLWKPGVHNEIPVRTEFILPIRINWQ